MPSGDADMALHSLKDLPGNDEYYANTDFSIGACLPRSDPRDALVVEYASANAKVRRLLAAIDDRETAYCYRAERALLKTLNGHCDSPNGGHAWIKNGKLKLKAVVISIDSGSLIEVDDETDYADPAALGTRVGERLNQLGAQTIIKESRFVD